MINIPLWEWSSINLYNTVLDESFSSYKFIIWCIINNVQNSGLSSNSFWSPVEVTLFESEGSEFIVSSSDSNSSNSSFIVDKLSIRYWSGFLESSLFFMNRHSTACWSSFMSWISWDTHWWIFLSQNLWLLKYSDFFLFIFKRIQLILLFINSKKRFTVNNLKDKSWFHNKFVND